jgi:hypothetical protein
MSQTDPAALYRDVERAAGRLIRSWRLLFVVTCSYAVASAGATVLAFFLPDLAKAYALGFAVITAIMIYNASRFVPRRSASADPTIPLTADDGARVSAWVAGCTDGWRPAVRVSARPVARFDGETLVLGLPLCTCLRQPELAVLVRDARRRSDSYGHGALAKAHRIAEGGINSRFRQRDGRDARLTRRLVARLDVRTNELADAHARWMGSVRRQIEPGWEASQEAALIVREAWDIVTRRWLEPALGQGVWHADPFTAVRGFIDGCERLGMIRRDLPRALGHDSTELLESVGVYARTLGELLVPVPHDPEPTAWADHPATVTIPLWRSFLAIGLQAADRATGTPQPATLENLLVLLENGWGHAIAAAVMSESGSTRQGGATEPVLENILAAAVSLALLDSGAVRARWRLPYGTLLETPSGRAIGVDALVLEALATVDAGLGCADLRAWMVERGVNLSDPMWLAGGVPRTPERAVASFEAFRGLRTFHVVLTNQSLRVFRRGPAQAVREGIRMEVSGPSTVLSPRMRAVEAQDFTDQDTVLALNAIIHATFAPMIGGHWWRIHLRTLEQRLTLRGNGHGQAIVSVLESYLGDRLAARWMYRHRWLRAARNLFGFVCLSFGCLGLIGAVIVLLRPSAALTRIDALTIAAASFLLLLVGHLPDLLAMAVERLRRPAGRPHSIANRGGRIGLLDSDKGDPCPPTGDS